MEYTYSKKTITLPNKELTLLDRVALDFVSRIDVQYVIVSGYVAILFGRSRNTEDIDIFIKDDGLESFSKFYDKIVSDGKYWAINTIDASDAYDLMTTHKSSLRFAEKNTLDPNFEIKFANKETDYYSLENALTMDFGIAGKLKISPLEIEIAYKLFLGSEKDFADAKHIFITFKESLDMDKLKAFIRELNISKDTANNVLGYL
jgi:hypothetical protein